MKVAIVKLTSMGDVAMASFAPQLLRSVDCNINSVDWLCDSDFKDVIHGNPFIDNIFEIPIRRLKKTKKGLLQVIATLRQMKSNKYDIIIDLQGTIKSAIVARMIKSKNTKIYGFSFTSAKEGFASLFYNKHLQIAYNANIIKRNLMLTYFAVGKTFSQDVITRLLPSLYFNDRKTDISIQITNKIVTSKPEKIIFVNFFSSKKTKHIPVDIMMDIIKNYPQYLFVSHYYNQDEKIELTNLIHLSNFILIDDRLDINELKYLIATKVDLLIGSDSGISHFASLLKKPSIIAFTNDCGIRNTLITQQNSYCKISDLKKSFNKLVQSIFSI
jgi:heptosyltransferase-1